MRRRGYLARRSTAKARRPTFGAGARGAWGFRRREARGDAGAPLVIFLGDSLTAGHGLPQDDAFPALVARKLASAGRPIRIVNAGVSGETTAGGVRRLDWLMRQRPDVFVLCLGGNDGLRGLSLRETESNLRSILDRARSGGARTLLLGMKIPSNLGEEYTSGFEAIYPGWRRRRAPRWYPSFSKVWAASPS